MSQRNNNRPPTHDPRYNIYPNWPYDQVPAPSINSGFGIQPEMTYRQADFTPNGTYEQSQSMIPPGSSQSHVSNETSYRFHKAERRGDLAERPQAPRRDHYGGQAVKVQPLYDSPGRFSHEGTQKGKNRHSESMIDANTTDISNFVDKRQTLPDIYATDLLRDPNVRKHQSSNEFSKHPASVPTRSVDQSITPVPSSTVPNAQRPRVASETQAKDIGRVIYHSGAERPYRFKCDSKECSEVKSMVRPQELKRHYFTTHEVTLLECPYDGCSKRLARGDKLKEHCQKVHGEKNENRLGNVQTFESYQEDDFMFDEEC